MKRFDVTLVFGKSSSYGCVINSETKETAKAQAMTWARQCGFTSAVKKTEIIEVKEEVCNV